MLNNLLIPNMRLVFIDDGGTPCKPITRLPTDYQLYAGVRLLPNCYQHVVQELTKKLADLNNNIQEFHATEIVNPKKGSAWSKLDVSERACVIQFLAKTLDQYSDRIYYCYVNGDQYTDISCRAKKKQPEFKLGQKPALWKVFSRSLIDVEHSLGTTPIRLVADSEKKLNDEIEIQDFAQSLMLDGKIIYANSTDVPGLQLADYAAYLINRIHHVAERSKTGKTSELDIAVVNAFTTLRPKIYNLLDS